MNFKKINSGFLKRGLLKSILEKLSQRKIKRPNSSNLFLTFKTFSFIAMAFLFLSPTLSFAQQFMGGGCSMRTYAPMNFFLDYQKQTMGRYGTISTDLPPVSIEGCQKANGQFLAFGLALRKPSLASDVSDVSYDGVLKPDLCRIESSPVPLETFEEKKRTFDEQFKLLRKCAKIEVTHLQQKPLKFNSHQNFCEIKALSPFKIEAQGDMCFLPITPDLNIALGVILDQKCVDEEFIKNNQIQPNDIEALLNAYVVPTDDGDYINNQIGSQKVRITLLPSNEIMPVYEDTPLGGPRFPTQYSPDVYMGKVTIKDDSRENEERTYIEIKVFVNNKSKRTCANGICAGPGDYQMPLAAEAELFEIKDGKKRHIDSWYTGNVYDPFVRAQWQGVYSFGRYLLENYKMERGAEYEIALNFYNPYDDFLLLTRSFDLLTIDLTHLNGTAGLDNIRPINSLIPIKKMPLLNSLPPLGAVDTIGKEFEKIRQFFKSFGSEIQFPPVYESICNNNSGQCTKANQRGYYLKLSTRFTLGDVNDEDLSFKFKNERTSKDSIIYNSTLSQEGAYPEYRCD